MKTFRTNGAKGALLDEYEKALEELLTVIAPISNQDLIKIVDHKTTDPDCKSIQTILNHVIGSGYTYVIEIRKYLGEEIDYRATTNFDDGEQFKLELLKMFAYNEKLFDDYPEVNIVEKAMDKKIKVRWGQQYDIDQLMEHAILHILRHRRQIEKFVRKLKDDSFSL